MNKDYVVYELIMNKSTKMYFSATKANWKFRSNLGTRGIRNLIKDNLTENEANDFIKVLDKFKLK